MSEIQIKWDDFVKLQKRICILEDGYRQAYYDKRGEIETMNKHINDLKSENRFLRRQILQFLPQRKTQLEGEE